MNKVIMILIAAGMASPAFASPINYPSCPFGSSHLLQGCVFGWSLHLDYNGAGQMQRQGVVCKITNLSPENTMYFGYSYATKSIVDPTTKLQWCWGFVHSTIHSLSPNQSTFVTIRPCHASPQTPLWYQPTTTFTRFTKAGAPWTPKETGLYSPGLLVECHKM